MNQKLLTVLGCSGSVALTLLSANSATAKEYVFTSPEIDSQVAEIPTRETDYPFLECNCNQYDADVEAAVDRQGDQAIELYGCDCAGCRNLVRNSNTQQQQSPSS